MEVKIGALHDCSNTTSLQSHILLDLACPNGGTGRRAGLKIRSPKTWCGFDSLFGHQILQNYWASTCRVVPKASDAF